MVLMVLLVAGLAVLATLQYRWIDRVSDAESLRIRASIDFAARRFTQELMSEIEELHVALTNPPPGVEAVISNYYDWQQRAKHPSLVEAIYAAEPFAGSWRLEKLDEEGNLVGVEWPRELEPVRLRLERFDLDVPGIDRPFGPPLFGEIPAIVLPPRRGRGPGAGWGPPPEEPQPFAERRDVRAVIVQLSRGELANAILPELTRRHFSTDGGEEYDVALVSREGVLYSSSSTWPDGDHAADMELPIMLEGPRVGPQGAARFRPEGQRPPEQGGAATAQRAGSPWRLLVRRSDGGLAQLVRETRNRNLAISGGILLILAATILLLLYLLRRADRLRTQQTEFVAAISHELNTPVAALRSAGENLKDGIITDRERLEKYGETIVREASRLGDMIGQVLEFAGMQARPGRTREEPVDVASVIEEAIAQSRWLVDGSDVQVQTQIASDLPRLIGDPRALTRAVQNLVANAIRHGGSGGWIGVRASRDGDDRVRIVVEDRGPGIDSRDASHLFEPFYRGRGASAVRGSGLGLTIVKQIVVAHGGSIEIERRRRAGAAFIIQLPVGEHA